MTLLVTTIPRVPRSEHSPLCEWHYFLNESNPIARCICGAWNNNLAALPPGAVTAGVSSASVCAGEAPATNAKGEST